MNPQQPLPADYLDQIAPQSQKAPFLLGRPILLGVIAVAAIIFVIIGNLVVGAIADSRKDPWYRLSTRLSTTSKIADSTTGKIKSSTLRSLNSEVKLFITNTNRDLKAPLADLGITTESIPANIKAEESADPALARLEDARLNAVYDRTYAREMTYELALVLSALQKAYEVSSSADTQQTLSNSYDTLKLTYDSFSEYSAAND